MFSLELGLILVGEEKVLELFLVVNFFLRLCMFFFEFCWSFVEGSGWLLLSLLWGGEVGFDVLFIVIIFMVIMLLLFVEVGFLYFIEVDEFLFVFFE